MTIKTVRILMAIMTILTTIVGVTEGKLTESIIAMMVISIEETLLEVLYMLK